jgi:uncharacterized protein (TIGR00369 family)
VTEAPLLYAANTALGRFGIANLVDSPDPFVSSMPATGLINPVTGTPTAGPLAVLVDHAAGLVNHYRRADDEWTVSSELSLELTPTALAVIAAKPDIPVVATGRPVGTRASSAFGMCELTIDDDVIGIGTVRSVYVTHPGEFPQEWPPPVDGPRPTDLTEIMALRLGDENGSSVHDPLLACAVIHQQPNPVLNNSLAIVHGGVAAAGLELAACAALNADRPDQPLTTASLRVNFLRQFVSGDQSRYAGTALRVGRRSGVAEAQAIGADGVVALVGRITAYR